jgi:GNAT superfamily N-acetyltransferase
VRRELPGGYELDDDRSRIDLDMVHAYIGGQSYWAKGRSRATMEQAIDGAARVIGVYAPDGAQVGFARVISDSTTYAYLADVFVLEPHRRRGLATWLVETILAHPDLRTLRRWVLFTADADELYRRVGFGPAQTPERYMELVRHPRELYGKPG